MLGCISVAFRSCVGILCLVAFQLHFVVSSLDLSSLWFDIQLPKVVSLVVFLFSVFFWVALMFASCDLSNSVMGGDPNFHADLDDGAATILVGQLSPKSCYCKDCANICTRTRGEISSGSGQSQTLPVDVAQLERLADREKRKQVKDVAKEKMERR